MMTPRSDSKAAVKGTAASPLETAVIVTSGSLFNEQPADSNAGRTKPASALTIVGGMSLFQRAVLTLQRAGLTRLFVLADQNEEALRWCLHKDARLTAQIHWIPIREFPPQDARTWEALAQDIEGSCLVIGVQALFSRGLIERLRHETLDERGVLAVTHPSDASPPQSVAADMVVLPAHLLCSAPAGAAGTSRPGPLGMLMNRASAEGHVRNIATAPGTSCWYQPVRNGADAGSAERALFRSLTSDLDGFVDVYFNRKVAGPLTRLFLKWRWSPNTITILSIFIGLTAAVSFSLGTYAMGIIGALLFQASAIVDCCDGDVARLTFRESRFGALLDLLGDNAVHMAIFAGIAWAWYAETRSVVPAGLAAAAIVGNALSLWFVTRFKARQAADRSPSPTASHSDVLMHSVANRDFSVVILLFALLDGLAVFLWLAAIGSNLFWIYTAWISRTHKACA